MCSPPKHVHQKVAIKQTGVYFNALTSAVVGARGHEPLRNNLWGDHLFVLDYDRVAEWCRRSGAHVDLYQCNGCSHTHAPIWSQGSGSKRMLDRHLETLVGVEPDSFTFSHEVIIKGCRRIPLEFARLQIVTGRTACTHSRFTRNMHLPLKNATLGDVWVNAARIS
jgi:hypothetical protein